MYSSVHWDVSIKKHSVYCKVKESENTFKIDVVPFENEQLLNSSGIRHMVTARQRHPNVPRVNGGPSSFLCDDKCSWKSIGLVKSFYWTVDQRGPQALCREEIHISSYNRLHADVNGRAGHYGRLQRPTGGQAPVEGHWRGLTLRRDPVCHVTHGSHFISHRDSFTTKPGTFLKGMFHPMSSQMSCRNVVYV